MNPKLLLGAGLLLANCGSGTDDGLFNEPNSGGGTGSGAAGAASGGDAAGGPSGGTGSGGTQATGGGAGSGGGPAECPTRHAAEAQAGTVMVLLDTTEAYGNRMDIWEELQVDLGAAIQNASGEIEVGLHTYPQFGSGIGEGACGLTDEPEIAFAPLDSVRDMFMSAIPELDGNSPGGLALEQAFEVLAARETRGSRYVLLLSSGAVFCWRGGLDGSIVPAVDAAYAAAKSVSTIVALPQQRGAWGQNGALNPYEELSSIAAAGGFPRFPGCDTTRDCFAAGTCCYHPTQGRLDQLFARVAGEQDPCVFKVPADAVGAPDRLTVEVGGELVPRGGSAGWEITTETGKALRLTGSACGEVDETGSNVSIVVACLP